MSMGKTMKGSWLSYVVALAGACVTLPAQTVPPTLFGDTRHLLPPGQESPVPPPPDPGYRPTPRQHPLPEPRFVEQGGWAVSRHSVFEVRLGPSLQGLEAVTIVTPEGKVLRGVPVALSLMDARSGRNVMIAAIKPGHRRVVEGNRVTYLDCWDDVRADVVYVLSRGRIAQHVVLRGPLPEVAKLGLDTRTTRLQVWTEVAPSEEPVRQTTLLKRVPQGLDFMDERLGLGLAEMVPGRAFMTGRGQEEARGVSSPVGKRYMKYGQPGVAGERAFLVEEVECEPLWLELEKAQPKGGAGRREGAMMRREAGEPDTLALVTKGDAPGYAFPRREGVHSTVGVNSGLAGKSASQLALVVDWELVFMGDSDEDSDGLPDTWEYLWFGSLESQAWYDDGDGDGWDAFSELYYGYNPVWYDTDWDGLWDYGSDPEPLVPAGAYDVAWVDYPNQIPTNGLFGSWNWLLSGSEPPLPAFWQACHYSLSSMGLEEHGFTNYHYPLLLSSNALLFAYVYIPPHDPPLQIALHWMTADGNGWRSAYWGTNAMGLTNAIQISAGLPPLGLWARISVGATQVNLGGKTINGMKFSIFNGRALWDRSGVSVGNQLADFDGDGLPDWREMQLGTDPHYPDTDYDGVSDGQEVAEGTNPLNFSSVVPRRLGYWKFNTSNFVGEQGQVPTFVHPTVGIAPSWSSNAMTTVSNIYSGVRYREYETNGQANINVRNGTVRLWFKPNWSSTNLGGAGPGTHSRFIELGYYTEWPNWVGHWAFGINPQGTFLWFQSFSTNTTNWSTTIYTAYGVPISWRSNEWHQIVLTYTPTNSAIYLDGQLAGTGGGVTNYPNATLRAQHGLRVGYDHYGAWANGHFEELETFNYPLSAATISTNYQSVVTRDTDGDGVTDLVELALGRNPYVSGYTADTNNQTGLIIFTTLR